MTMNYAYPALGNISLPYAGGVDIEENDLIFLCPSSPYPLPTGLTADVAYPAASLPDQGTAARNQRLFAKNFAGVSVERHLATSTSSNDEMNTSVCPVWIGDASLASAAICIPGMLVGVAENGGNNGIQSQTLAVVTDPSLSIGQIVQDSGGVAVTSIRVCLTSNLFFYGPHSPQNFQGVLRESFAYSNLTITGAGPYTGTYNFAGKLPVGAIVTGWRAVVTTPLSGPSITAATMQIGVTGTVGAFTGATTQPNVFTGCPASTGALSTITYGPITSELSPVATLTITGGNAPNAGAVTVEILYVPPMSP